MASTVTEMLRRRFGRKEEEWILINEVTLGGDVIIPLSYDAGTGYYEVASFPSWYTATAGQSQNATLYALDVSDVSSLPFPSGNNSSQVNVNKVDDTHFYLNTGEEPKGTVNIRAWGLAEHTDKTRMQILSESQLTQYDGIPIRIVINNSNSIITKYHTVLINGISNYSLGAKPWTSDSEAVGYQSNKKYKGNITLDIRFDKANSMLYTDNIVHEDCVCSNNGITSKLLSYDNLEGTTSESIWGYSSSSGRGVFIGGMALCRPDCTVKVYVHK